MHVMIQILSWEFCAQHHEELLPRRLVAPQVLVLHFFLSPLNWMIYKIYEIG